MTPSVLMYVILVSVMMINCEVQHGGSEGAAIILWWTPFTGVWGDLRSCDLGSCYFTEDRGLLKNRRTKVVLFYGSDFSVEDLPLPRGRSQWWGLLHEESPKNQPLLDHQVVLELFNLTSTFRRESNFPLTFQHLESIEALISRDKYVHTHDKNSLTESEGLAPVLYVQSDCDTPSERDRYVEELSKYIKVDSYGSCLHSLDLPSHLQDPAGTYDHEDFLSLVAKYKFTLAIENAACDDYVTEKLWRPLRVGSVPVYWGSPSVTDWEPNPGSLILISDFDSPRDLAKYLYKIMANETLYESHLRHKIEGEVSNSKLIGAMEDRKWGINNDFEKGNFIEHFECYVCNEVLLRHSSARPGDIMATSEHYGCPEPPSVLKGEPNRKNFWVEQWHKAQVEAKVLRDLVEAGRTFLPQEFYEQVLHDLQRDGFFKRFPPEHVEL